MKILSRAIDYKNKKFRGRCPRCKAKLECDRDEVSNLVIVISSSDLEGREQGSVICPECTFGQALKDPRNLGVVMVEWLDASIFEEEAK